MLKTLAIALGAFAILASAADVVSGTWELNTAKSKYTGTPMPKQLTVTYQPEGSGWVYRGKGVTVAGDPIESNFTYVKDGEEIRATGFPLFDTITLKNGNAAKGSGVYKRGGKQVGTVTRTVSADGKTMTVSSKSTGPKGEKVTVLAVYDKK